MGFSTSGAVLVILVGFLVAISVIVPTVFSVGAATGDAFAAQNDQLRDQQNTALSIDSFEYTGEDGESDADAIVVVTNDGSTSLSVDKTDLVANGHFYPTQGYDDETTIIDGEAERDDSDVWTPGTQLEIELSDGGDANGELEFTGDEDEDSIRITTERGVAETAWITVPE
ncbi:flagellin [Natrialba hulunbeirensis JCM 10989]|uniref:Flagellin n=1 Tax=Natrialba hulunbeirensis JCM 10989 TaxID=1227493 RepID=L9ZZ62_9EURY|nr:flagellin [Natrialba hulunbeirensis]ELY90418.1 flagellin [Natrialba hulunbeirensis JCM 10989]